MGGDGFNSRVQSFVEIRVFLNLEEFGQAIRILVELVAGSKDLSRIAVLEVSSSVLLFYVLLV